MTNQNVLVLEYTTQFKRDVKRLQKKHVDLTPLSKVIKLIETNSKTSLNELRRHHRMHQLKGQWAGAHECHVANLGNWLLVWQVANDVAVLLRTGTHQEIFR